MKKQILKQMAALVLAGAMCLSFAGAVDAKPFSDVGENDWYYYAVAMAHDVGYMNGYPDGTFHPNATITRAECVAIIDRMADPTIPIGQEIQFEDIPSSAWYNSSAAVCGQVMGGTSIQYLQSYPLGYIAYFYPERACTREDFAYGLSNVLNLPDIGGSGFDDYAQINPQYADAIMKLRYNGIINGDGKGRYGYFHPKDTITRAEVAQIITNYVQWNLSNH